MTMSGFSLSQSPRTQGFAQEGPPEDEEEIFSKGFSDLAYRAFQKAHPELYGDLVSFRVLATEAPTGEGVGAFILKRDQEVIFIPAVLADNAVKPLDLMYVRSKDRFYPLTPEWLSKATAGGVSSLGLGVEPPKDLNTDVDIRNLVVPPTTGRYSYAADVSTITDRELLGVFRAAYENEKRAAADAPFIFPDVVRRMPPTVKTAYAKWLSRRPHYFRKMAEVYGAKTLQNVFTVVEAPVKTASENRREVPMKHDVYLATASTPIQEVQKELGRDEMPAAYRALRYYGFYIKDRRKGALNDIAVGDEEALALTTPTHPGVYRIHLADGSNTKALVVPHPVCLERDRGDHAHMAEGPYSTKRLNDHVHRFGQEGLYLVLLPDGRGGTLPDLVAEPITQISFDEVASFLKAMTTEAPENGQRGVLIAADNLTLRATEPFYAEKPTTQGDMTTFHAGYDTTAVISKKMTGSKIVKPLNQSVMVFPQTYRWFHIRTDLSPRDILASPQLISRAIEAKVEKTGAARLKVARDHDGFRVGDARDKLSAVEAVVKVANLYGVSVGDATSVVEAVANGLALNAWVRPKTAAPQDGQQMPPEGMDPNAMDPNMMAPPPPPPMSGIDLAISEKIQLLQSQRTALEQMEQMLTELQMRSQSIDQGGGAMAAPQGAAGMIAGPEQTVMGQPAMAPLPGLNQQGMQCMQGMQGMQCKEFMQCREGMEGMELKGRLPSMGCSMEGRMGLSISLR